MAEQVPGLGNLKDVPEPVENASFDGLDLGPEDWFILSRIDGRASLRDVVAMSPRSKDETWVVIRRLLDAGLITLPNARPQDSSNADGADSSTTTSEPGDQGQPPEGETASSGRDSTLLPLIPEDWPTLWDDFDADPDAMAEEVELSDEFKRALLYYHAHMEQVSYYTLLGVSQDARSREIRRRYFKLSKAFHPDRFFRKNLGSFEQRLNDVFRWVNEANRVLTNKRRREQYDSSLDRGMSGTWGRAATMTRTQPPRVDEQSDHFAPRRKLVDLIAEAKKHEKAGEFAEAFQLYEAALKQRRSPELMNRGAECLARTQSNLVLAEERARGAVGVRPDNARYLVTLAYVLELQDKTLKALETYEKALELDPQNKAARTRLNRLRE